MSSPQENYHVGHLDKLPQANEAFLVHSSLLRFRLSGLSILHPTPSLLLLWVIQGALLKLNAPKDRILGYDDLVQVETRLREELLLVLATWLAFAIAVNLGQELYPHVLIHVSRTALLRTGRPSRILEGQTVCPELTKRWWGQPSRNLRILRASQCSPHIWAMFMILPSSNRWFLGGNPDSSFSPIAPWCCSCCGMIYCSMVAGALKELTNDSGPHLVVAPASLLENWAREIERWCPAMKVVTYYGQERDNLRYELQSARYCSSIIKQISLTSCCVC